MREKIAIRLHARDRSIMKVLYESAPLNVPWEALTWTQRGKYLKDAEIYINDFSEEIEKVEFPYLHEYPYDEDGYAKAGWQDCKDKILSLLKQ